MPSGAAAIRGWRIMRQPAAMAACLVISEAHANRGDRHLPNYGQRPIASAALAAVQSAATIRLTQSIARVREKTFACAMNNNICTSISCIRL